MLGDENMQNEFMTDNCKKERSGNRYLLFLYDVLAFLGVLYVLYEIRPGSIESEGKVLLFADYLLVSILPFVCIFGFRFLFRVYRQILRYGNMDALARLLGGVDMESEEPGAVIMPFGRRRSEIIEPINDIQRVTRQFFMHGDVVKIEQMNSGYIVY